MADRRKSIRLAAIFAGLVTALGIFLIIGLPGYLKRRPIYLRGAVIAKTDDPTKESPIADVDVSVADGLATGPTRSSFNGFFSIRLRPGVNRNQSVTLTFRHVDYEPLDLTELVGDRLSIVHLVPIHKDTDVRIANLADHPVTSISNILIRYSTVSATQQNIGTAAKIFEVQNVGNVPCGNSSPCSPDGQWKASVASASLDAGEGSEFRNARVSCIAGPCPFTRIDSSDGLSQSGRYVKVTVLSWSDTTTFLLEAEVFHPQIDDIIRLAYPVILGTSLDFSLPPTAEGPTIEAELNGQNIVFPLGPTPILSWADCNVSVDKNQAKFYRCDLKSDYRFGESK